MLPHQRLAAAGRGEERGAHRAVEHEQDRGRGQHGRLEATARIAVMKSDQTVSGIRDMVMPGDRILMTVVM